MATQTTNYNLVKPALTDSPPDITVMNPNWDKIDSELKINSSAIGQIANERGYISTKELNSISLNTVVNNGIYFVRETCSNVPDAINRGFLEVCGYNTSWATQIFHADYINSKSYKRNLINGVWQTWKEIATTQKNIPTLLNGWLTNGTVACSKSGNVVTLNLRVKSGSMAQFSTILNLPSGFEPTESVLVFARDVGGASIGKISINTNGSVTIFSLSSNADVVINASWVTV